jgi:hypothetical protein
MTRPARDPSDELQRIPGIGPALAADLRALGAAAVADLRGRDPQQLYDQFVSLSGQHVDRCVLYAFRCAVYFAATARPDPELTKWWNWKDGGLAERRGMT